MSASILDISMDFDQQTVTSIMRYATNMIQQTVEEVLGVWTLFLTRFAKNEMNSFLDLFDKGLFVEESNILQWKPSIKSKVYV